MMRIGLKNFMRMLLVGQSEKSKMLNVSMDYWMVMTGDGPGINGGVYNRKDNSRHKLHSFDCTVLVDDIDKVIKAVKANGGQIRALGGKRKVGDERFGLVFSSG